jgi:hypothetical protein
MSLLPCSLRKKYFTIILCSIRSIQIFITYISNADQKVSSAPDPMDRFSCWTHLIDSEIDLVSRMLFDYWQFTVLRKRRRRSGLLAILEWFAEYLPRILITNKVRNLLLSVVTAWLDLRSQVNVEHFQFAIGFLSIWSWELSGFRAWSTAKSF